MPQSSFGRLLATTLSIYLAFSPSLGLACTTFSLGQSQEKIVGKSYDWFQNHGVALVNQRNLRKKAFLLTSDKPAEWTAKYGSLTFNQHGREMPLGGMNEKGLTVEIMWLDDSEYPVSSALPAVNELQWIQYLLDNAADVAEAAQLATGVRVIPAVAKVHYLACDSAGDCATFEYIDQKLVIHEGTKAPVSALTNDSYADSLKSLTKYVGFGGSKPLPKGTESLSRFARAANQVRGFDPAKVTDAVEYAFQTLSNVAQSTSTWNIVYESANHRVHFRTLNMPKIKSLDTSKFDYSCKRAAQFVDMKAKTEGEITGDFADFGDQQNDALVQAGIGPFASQLPAGAVDRMKQYAKTLVCTE